MEARKVDILPDTLKLAQRPLGRAEKLRLKEAKIVELVRNTTIGQAITYEEFTATFGGKKLAAYPIVRRMVAEGKLARHETEKGRWCYTVPEDSVTIVKPRAVRPSLTELGMRFCWEHPDTDAKSLKLFVDWLEALDYRAERE